MRHIFLRTLIHRPHYLLLVFFLTLNLSCSDDDVVDEDNMELGDTQGGTDDDNDNGNDDEDSDNGDGGQGACTDVANFVFAESNGLVNVEFENAVFSESWEERSTGNNFTGDGYMVWTGNQFLGQPGNGLATFSIEINNPGTYQFLWRSAVTTGDNGTEHNDTWLRFGDADDFFAQNGNSIVYPKGSGKTPTPEGGGADGWFKVYRSGNDLDFKWQARTFDNNAHNIFVTFNEAGIYTMEVSARSSGHAIDRFVLFNSSFNQSDAVSDSNELSAISCN